MSSEDPSGTEKEPLRQRLPGSWRPVDRAVWSIRGPPPSRVRRISNAVQRFGGLLLHPVALPFLGLAGIVGFVATFNVAFYIGGANLFGPVLVAIWAAAAVVGVVVLEKSGYSRNFAGWDFPARKILYGIGGMSLGLGIVYFLFYVLLAHH